MKIGTKRTFGCDTKTNINAKQTKTKCPKNLVINAIDFSSTKNMTKMRWAEACVVNWHHGKDHIPPHGMLSFLSVIMFDCTYFGKHDVLGKTMAGSTSKCIWYIDISLSFITSLWICLHIETWRNTLCFTYARPWCKLFTCLLSLSVHSKCLTGHGHYACFTHELITCPNHWGNI